MAFQGHAMLRKKNQPGAVFEHNESSISTKSNQRKLTSTIQTSIESNSHYKIPDTKPSKQLLPTNEVMVPKIPNEIKLVNDDQPQLVSSMNLQEENMFLKLRLQHVQNELEAMKKTITPKHRRKARKELEKHSDLVGRQFPKICVDIAKDKIWRYVKFINDDSMLDDYNEKSSIGYLFLSFYRKIDTQNKYKVDAIWDEAKDYVCEAIAAKRNATQTRIKKSFKGNK